MSALICYNKNMGSRVKISITILLATLAAISFSSRTHAQSAEPQMVVTWKAYGSYIPARYTDKALPNQESQMTASLELLVNGRPVDLSYQTIYWYLNDTLISSGVGNQSVIFSPFGTAPSFLTLEAELPSYDGTTLVHDVQIPLVQPKAVIEAPHPSGQSSANPITLQGVPYFFYVSDPGELSYSWSVNDQTPAVAENPQMLQISLDSSTPSGSSLNIGLTITNSSDQTSAEDSTAIIYMKQP